MNQMLSEEEIECLERIKIDNNKIYSVPREFFESEVFCLECIKIKGTNLFFVPEGVKTYEIILTAVKNDGAALKYVPKKSQNMLLCMTAIKNNGRALGYVWKRLISKEMCMLAVENTGAALKFVPEKFLCHEMYERSAKNSRDILSCLPKQYITKELYKELINKDGEDGEILKYIPKNRLSRDMCYDAVRQSGLALRYVPSRLINEIMCMKAVEQNGLAVQYVPHQFMTEEVINAAITQNALALGNIQEDMRTLQICKKCLDIEPKVLKYIPEKFCTKELCLQAIERGGDAAQGIPVKYKYDLDIARSERKLGVRKTVKKCYQDGRFWVREKIPEYRRYDLEENNVNIENIHEECFESFDEFYQYLDGNLDGVDFGNYIFDNMKISDYNIGNSLINNEVLRKQNLYDDSYYAKNIRLFASNAELRLSEANEQESTSIRLDEYVFNDSSDKIVYYISDLHLDHKILKRFPEYGTQIEIESYIAKIVDQIVNSAERDGMLLIAGDVSYRYEICKCFYSELVKKWKEKGRDEKNIIVVLGNHELWNGYTDAAIHDLNVDDIVEQYREMFREMGITFLHNDLLVLQRRRYIVKREIIKEEEVLNYTNEDLQNVCAKASFVVYGGLGFSGYNTEFNVKHGIYRSAIKNLEEDIKQTQRFEVVYEKLIESLCEKRIVILSHTGKENWSLGNYQKNWIYVHGHTHRNEFEIDEYKTEYADNQVGYYGQSISLKHFYISPQYDIFQFYEDGKYVVTREKYLDFNSGQGIEITFSDTSGIIYMLKRNGLYCFIYKKGEKLYLLDGGKQLCLNNNLDYYYANLPEYAQKIDRLISKYNNVLKSLSAEIKKIGGSGKIHGCIVDIDFFNHLYLNPHDGTVTPYYALSIVQKVTYPDVHGLIKANREDLYQAYVLEVCKNKNFLQVNPNVLLDDIHYVKETYMYEPSRIMKKLQYTSFNNIVRIWNDDLLNYNRRIK